MRVLHNVEVNFDKRLPRSGNTGSCYLQGDKKVMTFFRIWITCKSSINSSGGTENPCRTPLTVKVSIYSSPVHFTPKKTFHFNFFLIFCLKRFMMNVYDFLKSKMDICTCINCSKPEIVHDHAWYAIASQSGSFVMFIRSSFFFLPNLVVTVNSQIYHNVWLVNPS